MHLSKMLPFPSIRHSASTLVLLVLLMCTTLPATAQERERQQREVATFSEIAYSIPGTLHLRQGDEQSVEVEATPEVLEEVETTIDGGTLEIRSARQSGWLGWLLGSENGLEGDINVYVTAPTIEALSLAGSGNVVGETPFDGASFEINVAGSGALEMGLNVQDLEISVAGSGTTRLEGKTGSAEVSVAGSGDVYLPEVEELNASIAGSGNVWYQGDPQIETSIFGSGAVRSQR